MFRILYFRQVDKCPNAYTRSAIVIYKKKKKNREGKAHDFLAREKRKWRLPWPCVTNPSSVRKSRERVDGWRVVKGKQRYFDNTLLLKKKKNVSSRTPTCIVIVDNSVEDSFQYR